MPLYEYICDDCDDRFEILKGAGDDEEVTCPKCEAKARKLISGFAVRSSGSSRANACTGNGNGGSWGGG